jgi:integrase
MDWPQEFSLYTAKGQRKYLTALERERFIAVALAHPRKDVGALGLTLAYTGMRISEALSLSSESLQSDTGLIAVRSLKKRGRIRVREIPAPPVLFTTLIALGRAPGELLWPMSRSQAWRLIKALMVQATIAPGIHATPKGLRHSYGLHAVRSKVPLNLLQRWLGHVSMKTTAIYADAVGREEYEIAARMWS